MKMGWERGWGPAVAPPAPRVGVLPNQYACAGQGSGAWTSLQFSACDWNMSKRAAEFLEE